MQDHYSVAAHGLYTLPPAGPRMEAPGLYSWQVLMRLALQEARDAALAGEVPVGAVIVSANGAILAAAGNCVEQSFDPCGHAEIRAIRKAAREMGSAHLCNCVLVCTLEPCAMCLTAMAHAHIAGLVYGASDMAAGAVQSACDWQDLPLGGRTFWHMGGILAEESALLLQEFFRMRRRTAGLAPPGSIRL